MLEDAGSLLSFKLSDLSTLRYSNFGDFVGYLGLGAEVTDSSPAMVAAHTAFAAPLPPNWSEQVEQDSMRIYFYNSVSDESRWAHPQDAAYREILDEVRRWSPDMSTEGVVQAIDAHLRLFRERAVASLQSWSGPYTAPASESSPELTSEGGAEAEYYFNSRTRESCWEHPAQAWEYELYTRYIILYKCLVAWDRANIAKALPSEESSSEPDSSEDLRPGGSTQRYGGVTALAKTFLSSLRLPLPQLGAVEPPAQRPTGQADPSLSMRSDNTSSVYLTARSEAVEGGSD